MQTALPTARFAALAIIPGISHRRDSSVDSGSGLSDNLFEDVPSRVELPSHYADFSISPLSSTPDFLN